MPLLDSRETLKPYRFDPHAPLPIEMGIRIKLNSELSRFLADQFLLSAVDAQLLITPGG